MGAAPDAMAREPVPNHPERRFPSSQGRGREGDRSPRAPHAAARFDGLRSPDQFRGGATASSVGGRRLSEAERRALQERRRAHQPNLEPPPGRPRQPSNSRPVNTSRAALAPSLAAKPARGEAVSQPGKPVPKMPPRPKREETVQSRGMVLLGTFLVVGLALLAFAGGRLFGGSDDAGGGRNDGVGTTGSVAAAFPSPAGTPTGTIPPPPAATPGLLALADDDAPTVCLDPGHGGEDDGFTRSPLNPLYLLEKDLVLQHAWDLEFRLESEGFNVVMTRDRDTEVNPDQRDVNGDGKTASDDPPDGDYLRNLDELQARIDVCNRAKADLLVSMHVNGFTTSVPRGYETWYTNGRPFSNRSREFACLAYSRLKEQLGAIGYAVPEAEERGCNPDTAVDVDDDAREQEDNYIVTGPAVKGAVPRASDMPGAIVEALFLSNDQDANVLASPGGRAAIVDAYELAILDYFDEYPPDSDR